MKFPFFELPTPNSSSAHYRFLGPVILSPPFFHSLLALTVLQHPLQGQQILLHTCW